MPGIAIAYRNLVQDVYLSKLFKINNQDIS